MASHRPKRRGRAQGGPRREPASLRQTRRSFLKTTAGILAAASGLGACEGAPTGAPPPGKGTLDVKVTGLTGASSGGTVSGQMTNDPSIKIALNMPNPTGDVAEGNVPGVEPGSYDILYAPPGLYEVQPGLPNPVTVVVAPDEIKQVPFACQVIVTNGGIHVVATGLTSGNAGGTVLARKSDNTGNTFSLTMPLPTAGTSSGDLSGMPPATYTVTYTPPPGFQLVNAGSSPATVVVTGGNIAAASFACQAVVIPGGVAFSSDWSTALGTSIAALRDTNKAKPWSGQVTNNPLLNVVAATGLGFPAGIANVLQVTHRAGTQASAHVFANQLWPVPAIGQTLFFRVYLRNAIADSEGNLDLNSHHPLEVGSNGSAGGSSDEDWEFTYSSAGNGTFPFKFRTKAPTFNKTAWCLGSNTGQNLNKNTTYRIEWAFTRTAANVYSLDIRIYGANDVTLLYDKNNIFGPSTGDPNLAASGNGLSITDLNIVTAQLGTNGGSWNLAAAQRDYWGGFCVRTDTWCGPYSAAG